MCLKRYPTEAEADARKYRDVIAYIESRSRPPKTQTLTEQQQQARADREARQGTAATGVMTKWRRRLAKSTKRQLRQLETPCAYK